MKSKKLWLLLIPFLFILCAGITLFRLNPLIFQVPLAVRREINRQLPNQVTKNNAFTTPQGYLDTIQHYFLFRGKSYYHQIVAVKASAEKEPPLHCFHVKVFYDDPEGVLDRMTANVLYDFIYIAEKQGLRWIPVTFKPASQCP